MWWDSESCLNPKRNNFLFCFSRHLSKLCPGHRFWLAFYGLFWVSVQFQSIFTVIQVNPPCVPCSGQPGMLEVVSPISQPSNPMVCSGLYIYGQSSIQTMLQVASFDFPPFCLISPICFNSLGFQPGSWFFFFLVGSYSAGHVLHLTPNSRTEWGRKHCHSFITWGLGQKKTGAKANMFLTLWPMRSPFLCLLKPKSRASLGPFSDSRQSAFQI